MAPPSIHPSGKCYTWVDETVPIAEAPGWLVALATKERERPAQAFQRNETAGDRWSDVEVQRMLDARKTASQLNP
jgi:Bifunctional DNA primase/polymerase, N-terminal